MGPPPIAERSSMTRSGAASRMLFTVWRLEDLQREPVQCTISERGGRWQLVVRRGAKLFLAERWPTDDLALARADEIWSVLVAQGWTPR